MPPKGISSDLDEKIQKAVKVIYNNAFYHLKRRIDEATSAFTKRELEEYVDVILKFHAFDNIEHEIGKLDADDKLKGYIGGQVRKYWQQQQFDKCIAKPINLKPYQDLFDSTRESTLLKDIEFDDMVDAYDGDKMKALSIPQQFDYNDQFAEFFELAYSKGMLYDAEDIVSLLDPKIHYQLLKEYIIRVM